MGFNHRITSYGPVSGNLLDQATPLYFMTKESKIFLYLISFTFCRHINSTCFLGDRGNSKKKMLMGGSNLENDFFMGYKQ